MAALVQYCVDSFASVAEAVASLRAQPFNPVGLTLPNGRPGTVHIHLADASGDAAVLEHVGGALAIWHSRNYTARSARCCCLLRLLGRKAGGRWSWRAGATLPPAAAASVAWSPLP